MIEVEKSPEEIIRETVDMITEHRQEVLDKVRTDIIKEAEEMEKIGFDPARGRSRGPWWAD